MALSSIIQKKFEADVPYCCLSWEVESKRFVLREQSGLVTPEFVAFVTKVLQVTRKSLVLQGGFLNSDTSILLLNPPQDTTLYRNPSGVLGTHPFFGIVETVLETRMARATPTTVALNGVTGYAACRVAAGTLAEVQNYLHWILELRHTHRVGIPVDINTKNLEAKAALQELDDLPRAILDGGLSGLEALASLQRLANTFIGCDVNGKPRPRAKSVPTDEKPLDLGTAKGLVPPRVADGIEAAQQALSVREVFEQLELCRENISGSPLPDKRKRELQAAIQARLLKLGLDSADDATLAHMQRFGIAVFNLRHDSNVEALEAQAKREHVTDEPQTTNDSVATPESSGPLVPDSNVPPVENQPQLLTTKSQEYGRIIFGNEPPSEEGFRTFLKKAAMTAYSSIGNKRSVVSAINHWKREFVGDFYYEDRKVKAMVISGGKGGLFALYIGPSKSRAYPYTGTDFPNGLDFRKKLRNP